uniref:Uncharacterized protein n=1 Tax=Ananas comosus var. bracteatus TaxID=296719 RepID=A0A6V7NNG2_ANACO|nr:unnamed protein product [Ananas comosus var. bracteatus]
MLKKKSTIFSLMHFFALEAEQPEELMGCDLDSSADAGRQDGVDGVHGRSSGGSGDDVEGPGSSGFLPESPLPSPSSSPVTPSLSLSLSLFLLFFLLLFLLFVWLALSVRVDGCACLRPPFCPPSRGHLEDSGEPNPKIPRRR